MNTVASRLRPVAAAALVAVLLGTGCEPFSGFGDPVYGVWVDNQSDQDVVLAFDGRGRAFGEEYDHRSVVFAPPRTMGIGLTSGGHAWQGTIRVLTALPECDEVTAIEWEGQLAMVVIGRGLSVSLVPGGHPANEAPAAVWSRALEEVEAGVDRRRCMRGSG